MRGFLGAIGFLVGMQLLAAAVVFVGFTLIHSAGLGPDTERAAIGWLALVALIVTGVIFRKIHQQLERR